MLLPDVKQKSVWKSAEPEIFRICQRETHRARRAGGRSERR
jgi:hypothetical protein